MQRYRRIILQPMGELPLVRRWLFAQGFFFREKLAVEKGRFYEIIAAEKGKEMVSEPAYLELGPSLLKGEDPLVIPWLEGKIRHYEEILQGLGRARSGKMDSKWRYFHHRYQIIRGCLKIFAKGNELVSIIRFSLLEALYRGCYRLAMGRSRAVPAVLFVIGFFSEVLEEALETEASFIFTHHPFLFSR